MAEQVMERGRLCPLGELADYRVSEGNPDIRGWDVFGNDSLRLGEVRELIVDTEAMKARYMVVSLDRTLPNVQGDRRVLVPVGRARLDDALDRVYLEDVTVATANTLPDYKEDAFTFEQERSLFGGTGKEAGFYDRPDYDARRFFGKRRQRPEEAYVVLHEEKLDVGKRQVQVGEAVVHKRVETEHVRETVPVMHEEVTVERRPVPAGQKLSGNVVVTDEEVRIPLMAEEAVLNKQVVATEEVVIKKTRVQENQVVEADLKRERADIETPKGTPPKKEPV